MDSNIKNPPVIVLLFSILLIIILFLSTSACELILGEDTSLEETNDQLRIELTINAFIASTLQAQQTDDSVQATIDSMQATNDAQATALVPSDTSLPSPTNSQVSNTATAVSPVNDTPTIIPPTISQDSCHVIFENNLPKNVHVTLYGPQPKSFQVQANSTYEFDIEPGQYEYNLEWQNYNPAHGVIEFPPGEFTWTWGKVKD